MSKRLKILLAAVIILFLVLISSYLVVAFSYSGKFFPNTYINSIEVSNLTPAQVERDLEGTVEVYELTIYDKDGTPLVLKGSEFNYEIQFDEDVDDFLGDQNSFSWPASMSQKKEYTISQTVSYDEDMLRAYIDGMDLMSDSLTVEAQDAYIDDSNDTYTIVEEVNGYHIDKDKVREEILQAVANGEFEVRLSDYEIHEAPAVTAGNEELLAELDRRLQEQVLDGIEIVHQFSSQERVLDEETIRSWVTYGDNNEIVVNRNQVYDYVLSLAYEFNTFGINRPFTTSRGQQIEIIGGDYGWIINKDAETDYLVGLIENAQSETREPIYENTANTHDGLDTGSPNTYIEIDLGNQYLWYYVDGALRVESPIITGLKGKWDTREGTFAVMFKKSDYPLKGETWDVTVDYFIAYYTNVGLHDATWQSEFGGDLYKSRGSHGCVNMPKDKVAQIFETVTDGTIVYSYY